LDSTNIIHIEMPVNLVNLTFPIFLGR
jgi:hypothetical protein